MQIFFIAYKHDKQWLLSIIKAEVVDGTIIRSDKQKAYNRLKDNGYAHKTVNHQKHTIDPIFYVTTIKQLIKKNLQHTAK